MQRARLGGEEGQEDGVDDEHRHQPLEPVGQRRRRRSAQHLHVGRVEGEVGGTERGGEDEAGQERPADEVVEGQVRHQLVDPGPEDRVGAGEDRAEDRRARAATTRPCGRGRACATPVPAIRSDRPNQGRPRSEASGQASPDSTMPGMRAGAGDAAQEHGGRGDERRASGSTRRRAGSSAGRAGGRARCTASVHGSRRRRAVSRAAAPLATSDERPGDARPR